jgi:hypothetical protein
MSVCWLLLLLLLLLAALIDQSICADVQQTLQSLGPLLERQRGSYPSARTPTEILVIRASARKPKLILVPLRIDLGPRPFMVFRNVIKNPNLTKSASFLFPPFLGVRLNWQTFEPTYEDIFSMGMKGVMDRCICMRSGGGTELWRCGLGRLSSASSSPAFPPPLASLVPYPDCSNLLSSDVPNASLLMCLGLASMAALMRRVACSNVRLWGKGPLARVQMARGFASRAPPVLVDEFK